MSSLLHKFESLLHKYPALFTYIIKPAFVLIVAILIGYFSLWMNANYLGRKEFAAHEVKQEFILKEINGKLTEILIVTAKTDTKVSSIKESIEEQKHDTDKLETRVTYLERNRVRRDNSPNN